MNTEQKFLEISKSRARVIQLDILKIQDELQRNPFLGRDERARLEYELKSLRWTDIQNRKKGLI